MSTIGVTFFGQEAIFYYEEFPFADILDEELPEKYLGFLFTQIDKLVDHGVNDLLYKVSFLVNNTPFINYDHLYDQLKIRFSESHEIVEIASQIKKASLEIFLIAKESYQQAKLGDVELAYDIAILLPNINMIQTNALNAIIWVFFQKDEIGPINFILGKQGQPVLDAGTL